MQGSRTVLITGASSGIGRAIALACDLRGYTVYAGVRKDADAEALKAASEGRLRPVRLDVTDPDQIAAAAQRLDAERPEGLWALINNAGIVVAGPMEFVPVERLRRQLEVNLIGQVAVTQAFLPSIRRRGGRVVFVGSNSGYFTTPVLGAYAASKHGLEAVADALRRELFPWKIPVSLLQPGSIKTSIWEKSEQAALSLCEDLPPGARALYGGWIPRVRSLLKGNVARAAPAERVAAAALRAVSARRPRARYKVGMDARLTPLLSLLPVRWVDAALVRILSGGDRPPAPEG